MPGSFGLRSINDVFPVYQFGNTVLPGADQIGFLYGSEAVNTALLTVTFDDNKCKKRIVS